MSNDLDLLHFDMKIISAHPWLIESKCMKFHDHRWITVSYGSETVFNHQCFMTLTFDLLTLKSIGHILDSWGACVWSFMIIGWLQSQVWSRNHLQFTMPNDLDLLTPKSIGHTLDSWGARVWSFKIIGGLQSQLWSENHFQSSMPYDPDLWPFNLEINKAHGLIRESVIVRKPFTINHAPWPWPLPSKSIGCILDSWGVSVWSSITISQKVSDLTVRKPTPARPPNRPPAFPPHMICNSANKKSLIYFRKTGQYSK